MTENMIVALRGWATINRHGYIYLSDTVKVLLMLGALQGQWLPQSITYMCILYFSMQTERGLSLGDLQCTRIHVGVGEKRKLQKASGLPSVHQEPGHSLLPPSCRDRMVLAKEHGTETT